MQLSMHTLNPRCPALAAAGLSRGSHLSQLQRFVKEIAQLEDVYFVTMRQLLAWMQVRFLQGAGSLEACILITVRQPLAWMKSAPGACRLRLGKGGAATVGLPLLLCSRDALPRLRLVVAFCAITLVPCLPHCRLPRPPPRFRVV